jgi:hypothetical protein
LHLPAVVRPAIIGECDFNAAHRVGSEPGLPLRRHKRLLYHWKIDYRVQNPGATLAEAPRRLSEVRVL